MRAVEPNPDQRRAEGLVNVRRLARRSQSQNALLTVSDFSLMWMPRLGRPGSAGRKLLRTGLCEPLAAFHRLGLVLRHGENW
jgi:hypothetical protein